MESRVLIILGIIIVVSDMTSCASRVLAELFLFSWKGNGLVYIAVMLELAVSIKL